MATIANIANNGYAVTMILLLGATGAFAIAIRGEILDAYTFFKEKL